MALSPEMLEAAYEFLRTTEPFRRWTLPHADDVAFKVTRNADRFGAFEASEPPAIAVSERIVGHSQTLLMTLAHEMIHLRHHRAGEAAAHGARFRRDAARVCRHHGWDAKAF